MATTSNEDDGSSPLVPIILIALALAAISAVFLVLRGRSGGSAPPRQQSAS